MLNSYYIRHRYLAFRRPKSKDNSWLVITLLLLFGFQICRGVYLLIPDLITELRAVRQGLTEEQATWLVFWGAAIAGIVALLMFSPPRLHHLPYRIWRTRPADITTGYLVLAPVSLPFIGLAALMMPLLIHVQDLTAWIFLKFLVMWLGIYYCTIAIHFSSMKVPVRSIVSATLVIAGLLVVLFASDSWRPHWWLGVSILIMGVFSAYWQLSSYQARQQGPRESTAKRSIWEYLQFRDALMQLEWALITRNRRTRSNLLAGFLAIFFVVFLLPESGEEVAYLQVIVMGILITAFPMLQHGIYMIGWEGSYFDLLISRVTMKEFFEFKYRFFLISSMAMFVICSIALFWNPELFAPLGAALIYNLGVNTYIVLRGSLANTTKLDLEQKSFFNTQALNGTLLLNSFLIVLIPAIVFSIAESFAGTLGASVGLAGLGLVGIAFHKPLMARIEVEAQRKKYSLAKGFRS